MKKYEYYIWPVVLCYEVMSDNGLKNSGGVSSSLVILLLIIVVGVGGFATYFLARNQGFTPRASVEVTGVAATGFLTIALIWVYLQVADALRAQAKTARLQTQSLRDQVESTLTQTIVQQESEWLPESYHEFGQRWLLFRDRRPWYPEFYPIVNGKEPADGWISQNVGPSRISYAKWVVEFPDDLNRFLEGLDQGVHSGKLYFKFESMTGLVYLFIYDIDINVSPYLTILNIEPFGYDITGVPGVERVLPWNEDDLEAKINACDFDSIGAE